MQSKLEDLEENKGNDETIMHLERHDEKIEKITLTINELLEKLRETNPDEFNMVELI